MCSVSTHIILNAGIVTDLYQTACMLMYSDVNRIYNLRWIELNAGDARFLCSTVNMWCTLCCIICIQVMYWGTAKWSPVEIFEAYSSARILNCIAPLCEYAEYHPFHREKVRTCRKPSLPHGESENLQVTISSTGSRWESARYLPFHREKVRICSIPPLPRGVGENLQHTTPSTASRWEPARYHPFHRKKVRICRIPSPQQGVAENLQDTIPSTERRSESAGYHPFHREKVKICRMPHLLLGKGENLQNSTPSTGRRFNRIQETRD